MKDSVTHIVFGGRGRGKMMAAEKWLEALPKEVREKVIVVKASDTVPELKGAKLPRIVDYDLETSEFTWKLWEKIKQLLESKRNEKTEFLDSSGDRHP
jgi:hypothetical protein